MEAEARSNHLVLSEPTEQSEQAKQAEGSGQASQEAAKFGALSRY